MFGENPAFDDVKNSPPYLIMYAISTNIINIICLNILISVVSDNYARIKGSLKAYDSRLKAQLLFQNEKVVKMKEQIFKKCCCQKKDKVVEDPKYLFYISYQKDIIIEKDTLEE